MIEYMKVWVELNANKLKMDERAVTALEYGLIAALIAVAIIGGVGALGTNLNSIFKNVSTSI